MKSMTGCGHGECAEDGFKVSVELAAVNRRQAELVVSLPREWEGLEGIIRERIQESIARGRVTVRVFIEVGSSLLGARPRLNLDLARSYASELRSMARELDLAGSLSLDHILRVPGLFEASNELKDHEQIQPVLQKALDQAITALLAMRSREGLHLAEDLSSRVQIMRQSVERIRQQAPKVAENHHKLLLGRIRASGLASVVDDDERILKEIVLFADRSDISEELTRLESHFQQFEDCRQAAGSVGRTLDFLSQEINREINTISSKANDALISREAVNLKAELEKFREQAQNVE